MIATGHTSLKRRARDLGVPKWPYNRYKKDDLGQGTKGHAGAGAGGEAAVAASIKSINSFDFASLDEAQRCTLNGRATELHKESEEYVHLGCANLLEVSRFLEPYAPLGLTQYRMLAPRQDEKGVWLLRDRS